MTVTNRGALLLREKLSARGAKAALAKNFVLDPALLSRWLTGERLPDPKQRARLEDEYGVSWRLWDEPAEPGSAANSTDKGAA